MIELQVTEREIKTSNKVDLIRGSKNYFKCKLSFDDFWKDFEKTVIFKRTYGSTPFAVRVKDMISEVIIPSEVLQESGTIKIGVFGIKGDATLPSLWSEDFKVLQGSDTSGEIPEPTPTIYEELLKEISNKQDVLISGENIKTINGLNILGPGNIEIYSWKKIVDITTTEEVNGIVATVEEFPDIAKCKEFVFRILFPKSPTGENLTLGASRIDYNNSNVMFRFTSTTAFKNVPSEHRCHCFIVDRLLYSIGTYQLTSHSAVTGNMQTLVGNWSVSSGINELKYYLNEPDNLLPTGTQLIIYGKV